MNTCRQHTVPCHLRGFWGHVSHRGDWCHGRSKNCGYRCIWGLQQVDACSFICKMLDHLMQIDPKLYGSCVTKEHNKGVMYVELLKALHGMIHATFLICEKMLLKPHEWGFTANPYDICMACKDINGKLLTMAWHIDDYKVLHAHMEVVEKFIEQMEQEFGKETHWTSPMAKCMLIWGWFWILARQEK